MEAGRAHGQCPLITPTGAQPDPACCQLLSAYCPPALVSCLPCALPNLAHGRQAPQELHQRKRGQNGNGNGVYFLSLASTFFRQEGGAHTRRDGGSCRACVAPGATLVSSPFYSACSAAWLALNGCFLMNAPRPFLPRGFWAACRSYPRSPTCCGGIHPRKKGLSPLLWSIGGTRSVHPRQEAPLPVPR